MLEAWLNSSHPGEEPGGGGGGGCSQTPSTGLRHPSFKKKVPESDARSVEGSEREGLQVVVVGGGGGVGVGGWGWGGGKR